MAATRKKAATTSAPAEPAEVVTPPAKPAKATKVAKAAKVVSTGEKPNWLVARLRNAVAKNFTEDDARKSFREAAKDASAYEDVKAAAGVTDEEWATFVAEFFNNGGKAGS